MTKHHSMNMKHEICGLEHLHCHSEYSLLDGLSKPEELAKKAVENNQKFLCITDHGMMGAIPRQIKASEENNIMPIFGCELYLQPNHDPNTFEFLSSDDKKAIRKSYHLLAIAFNEIGYKNLVQLSSWAWMNGFYYKPRINYEILNQHKEGIIFTSCCINGEIGTAFLAGGEEAGFAMIERYMAMFGEHFYLELMMLDYAPQKPYDKFLIKAHDKYHIPLILTQDCHYVEKHHSKFQRIMLMMQSGRTLADLENAKNIDSGDAMDFFELQDQNLWYKSENEINEFWETTEFREIIPYELFKQAKRNTVEICNKAKGVILDRSCKLPEVDNADEVLKEEIKKGVKWRRLSGKVYMNRIMEEYDLITRKGFASYFLIQKKVIDEGRRYCRDVLGSLDGSEAINPGRGSSAGSLICYCLGITDVDPIKHDLLFSRFLSEERGRQIKFEFTNLG